MTWIIAAVMTVFLAWYVAFLFTGNRSNTNAPERRLIRLTLEEYKIVKYIIKREMDKELEERAEEDKKRKQAKEFGALGRVIR